MQFDLHDSKKLDPMRDKNEGGGGGKTRVTTARQGGGQKWSLKNKTKRRNDLHFQSVMHA